MGVIPSRLAGTYNVWPARCDFLLQLQYSCMACPTLSTLCMGFVFAWGMHGMPDTRTMHGE